MGHDQNSSGVARAAVYGVLDESEISNNALISSKKFYTVECEVAEFSTKANRSAVQETGKKSRSCPVIVFA